MFLSKGEQILLRTCGISLVAWAYSDARFRDVEGFLLGGFCLPVAVGVALMILGWALSGRWRQFALWFALALVGQAVALQLIEAGPLIHYQHYKPFDRLFTQTHALLLIYLVAQAALVVGGLRSRWLDIRAWMGRSVEVWQLLGVGLIFFVSSAAVSRDIAVYVSELFFATFVQATNLGNVVLMVWALPNEALAGLKRRLDKLFGQPAKEGTGESSTVDRFALLGALWVVVVAAVLSFFSYEWHPHVQDEVIYLYHARYLAEGVLTVPAPPVPEAFSLYMVPYESARWYSIFPPGWPGILAVGVLLKVPWLVNPVLAGLNVLLIYILFQEIYDRRTARVAVVLLCTSPWYVFMGMNFMAHTSTLMCALAATLALSRARRTGKALWAWLGGAATGMASLIRPLDGLAMAGLLGLWTIGVGGQRLKATSTLGLVLGAIAVGAVVFPYNNWLTGDAMASPLMSYYDEYYGRKTNAVGFGPERGLGWALDAFPGHSPIEALINASLNIFSVNTELFGWSTGSLIIIALLLSLGTMRRNDHLMLAVVTAVVCLYSFYWFNGGPDFGARYWYLILVPLVALTTRGVRLLERMVETKQTAFFDYIGTRVIVAILSLCIFTLLNYFPWRAIDKYHHYLRMRPDIRYLAKEHGFGKSLVFIRGDSHPDYASAWVYNPLDPYADAPVYAWDRNPQVRAQVLKAYLNRPVWIVNGPSITHRGFEVIAGPLSAPNLLETVNAMR